MPLGFRCRKPALAQTILLSANLESTAKRNLSLVNMGLDYGDLKTYNADSEIV
jgi:hypothetical protein